GGRARARHPRGPALGWGPRRPALPGAGARGRRAAAPPRGLRGRRGRGDGAMTMIENRRRGARRSPSAGTKPEPSAGPAPRMRRPVELSLVGLAMVAALITQGGFTLVMNGLEQPTFEEVVMPFLVGEDSGLSGTEARLLGDTLAAWLGMSLVVLLLLAVAGI